MNFGIFSDRSKNNKYSLKLNSLEKTSNNEANT